MNDSLSAIGFEIPFFSSYSPDAIKTSRHVYHQALIIIVMTSLDCCYAVQRREYPQHANPIGRYHFSERKGIARNINPVKLREADRAGGTYAWNDLGTGTTPRDR